MVILISLYHTYFRLSFFLTAFDCLSSHSYLRVNDVPDFLPSFRDMHGRLGLLVLAMCHRRAN